MKKTQNNYAFIDSQNLYLGIKELGWKLDYKKFRVYLKEKYSVSKAFMCIGFIFDNQSLYQFLQEAGFILVFKTTVVRSKRVKGNVDAELVLQAMIEYSNYDQAVIISGDGDFCCLVNYLRQHNKLAKVLVPSADNSSSLLRKAARKRVALLSDLKYKLKYKNPHKD